ncbi:hypothetical protein [Spirosoma pulveris]
MRALKKRISLTDHRVQAIRLGQQPFGGVLSTSRSGYSFAGQEYVPTGVYNPLILTPSFLHRCLKTGWQNILSKKAVL